MWAYFTKLTLFGKAGLLNQMGSIELSSSLELLRPTDQVRSFQLVALNLVRNALGGSARC